MFDPETGGFDDGYDWHCAGNELPDNASAAFRDGWLDAKRDAEFCSEIEQEGE